jgi:hypothetical protein
MALIQFFDVWYTKIYIEIQVPSSLQLKKKKSRLIHCLPLINKIKKCYKYILKCDRPVDLFTGIQITD